MKKLLLPLFAILFLNNVNAQWASQVAPNPTNNLYSVFAISPMNVAAAGFTGLIRTTTGGATWTQQVTLGGVNMYELHSPNWPKWYALTQNNSWFLKMGISSTTLQGGKPDSILSLHFMNPACGIAVGTAGKIEATCDTGATWQLRTSGTTANLNAIWFADKDSGCTVGNIGVIKRTKDAGNTWTNIASGTGTGLNGIHFPTASIGFIVGNGGKVLKTMDAGLTWTSVPTGTLSNLNAVFFIDKDTGYVGGASGLIMKTITGGTTWTVMATGTSQTINSIHFTTPMEGWAVGNAGTILKYTGGAITTGIATIATKAQFDFFPNPVGNELTVRSTVKNSILKVHNTVGEIVYETVLDNEEMNLNVSSLKPGVYFMEFTDGDNIVVKKFVKE